MLRKKPNQNKKPTKSPNWNKIFLSNSDHKSKILVASATSKFKKQLQSILEGHFNEILKNIKAGSKSANIWWVLI